MATETRRVNHPYASTEKSCALFNFIMLDEYTVGSEYMNVEERLDITSEDDGSHEASSGKFMLLLNSSLK